MNTEPIFQVGKASITPEFTAAVAEAIEARELIKISVLKNCADDAGEIAAILSERTGSEVVQVIGKKIVLYKENKEKAKKAVSQEKTATQKKPAASRKAVNGGKLEKGRNHGRNL